MWCGDYLLGSIWNFGIQDVAFVGRQHQGHNGWHCVRIWDQVCISQFSTSAVLEGISLWDLASLYLQSLVQGFFNHSDIEKASSLSDFWQIWIKECACQTSKLFRVLIVLMLSQLTFIFFQDPIGSISFLEICSVEFLFLLIFLYRKVPREVWTFFFWSVKLEVQKEFYVNGIQNSLILWI